MTEEGRPDIDLLMASLRADGTDTHAFLQALAVKLEDALPGQVVIDRHGGLFSRDKSVKRIEVDLGDYRFTIAVGGHGRLQAQRVRVVRGVALRTEQLFLDDWIGGLATELSTQAESSSRARAALERLLLGQ